MATSVKPNLKAGQICPLSGRMFRSWTKGKTKWTTKEAWEREVEQARMKRVSQSAEEKAYWLERKKERRRACPDLVERDNDSQRKRRALNPERARRDNQKAATKLKSKRATDTAWRDNENLKRRSDHYRKYQAEYVKRRAAYDPIYQIRRRLSTRLANFLSRRSTCKRGKFSEAIGCSWADLKIYLESLFQPGMTWENRRLWHIDHMVPLSSAKDEVEALALCHYLNLQPLWAEDNQRKGDSIPGIADGKWSPTARSKQVGVVAIWKMMNSPQP